MLQISSTGVTSRHLDCNHEPVALSMVHWRGGADEVMGARVLDVVAKEEEEEEEIVMAAVGSAMGWVVEAAVTAAAAAVRTVAVGAAVGSVPGSEVVATLAEEVVTLMVEMAAAMPVAMALVVAVAALLVAVLLVARKTAGAKGICAAMVMQASPEADEVTKTGTATAMTLPLMLLVGGVVGGVPATFASHTHRGTHYCAHSQQNSPCR